jgi:transcriptional regulator with XRE-family HTH domain
MGKQDAYRAERTRLLAAFGEKLRAERERQNISQEMLAAIARVSRTEVSALELGLRDPHVSMLLILADALNAPPRVLLDGLFVPGERKPATQPRGSRPKRSPAGGGV